jgi:hypothetical protein
MLRRRLGRLAPAAAISTAALALAPPLGTAEAGDNGSTHAAGAVVHAHAARIRCRAGRGSTTIARSPTARMFTAANGNDYACLYRVGRAFYLSGSEHYQYELVRFAGPYVAYVENVEANDEEIGEIDLQNGRRHTFEIASPIEDTVCYGVGSLVLKGDGALAWIGTNFLGEGCASPPGPEIEVRRHDRRGLAILDSDQNILPDSLHLHGEALTWTDQGIVRSATLD